MTIYEQFEHGRYEKGILSGIEQGMHKGEHEAKLGVAKNLFEQGISLEIIKKSTALSDQDLSKLLKNH